MSLGQQIGVAVDQVFQEVEALQGFARRTVRDGVSVRRYYMATSYAEREVAVSRDTRWTKHGGKIYVDLCCFVPEVQQALTGVAQSWLQPDYSKPLSYFQYRREKRTSDLAW